MQGEGMPRGRLRLGAALVLALVLPGTARGEDPPPPPLATAEVVDLEVTLAADLRDAVLRIAQNEGVVAFDPISRKEIKPPSLPPVAQPWSVLPAAGTALALVKGKPLDVDVIGALSDHGVSPGGEWNVWLLLRQHGDPTEDQRTILATELAEELRKDKRYVASAKEITVELMKPPPEAHAKGLRVIFDQRGPSSGSPKAVPTDAVPPAIPAKAINALFKDDKRLWGGVEPKEQTTYDAEARHRTVVSEAVVGGRADDPWSLWSFLESIEAQERITVIEVRYSRQRFHLVGAASAKEGSSATVKFAVRHPWISSAGLVEDMRRIVAARKATAVPPKQRLVLRCPQDRLVPLVRLISAHGITIQTAKEARSLRPTSPTTVALAPSSAKLVGALSETLAAGGFRVEAIHGFNSRKPKCWITLAHDLPRSAFDAAKSGAIQDAVEDRLKKAWKKVAVHPFLKDRLGGAEIQPIKMRPGGDDPNQVGITVYIDMDLRESGRTARKAPPAAPLKGEALASIGALAQREGLSIRDVARVIRKQHIRDGVLRLEVSLYLEAKDMDLRRAQRILEAVELLPGTSVDFFSWMMSRDNVRVTITTEYALWSTSR